MELKTKDTFRVECRDSISQESLFSLYMYYQPVIGPAAAALYMTLYAEGRTQHTQENHSHLSALLRMSIDDIERARIRLEEYMLLRTYAQEQETRTNYIYVLHVPLSRENFLSSAELRNAYASAVGQKQAEAAVARVQSEKLSVNGYKEVTRIIAHRTEKRDYETDVVYSKVSPRYRFEDDDEAINFDYEKFFLTTSTLVFPAELRTQENLKLIGKLATVHGLSADRMRILVSKCINMENMTFDGERLKLLSEKAVPDITKASDPYSLPPVSFLQAKQNGAPVSLTDRRILEDLSVKMHFPPEVINVMIEYILKKSKNRLVRAFVEMVAGEWARDGVHTKEQAIAATKKKTTAQTYARKEKAVPAYMNGEQPEDTETPASEQDLNELRNLMKKMGGSNG